MKHQKKQMMRTLLVVSLWVLVLAGGWLLAGYAGAAGTQAGELCGAVMPGAEESYAAYTYTVKIYAGKEGYFDGDEKKHVKSIEGLSYGEEYTIDTAELKLTVKDPDRYYIRGIKPAGHDNDESDGKTYQSGTFTATEDASYTVAYGMAGGMVKYTVKYAAEDGRELLPSQEYYGMAGDKPVVSYKYVEGYIPNAYNLGKTLSETEGENVFTFTYTKNEGASAEAESEAETEEIEGDTEDGDNDGDNDADGTNAANGNNGDANGNGTANRTGAAAAGNNGNGNAGRTNTMRPQDYVDLDDGEAPLANAPDTSVPGAEGTQSGSGVPGWIWAIVIAAVLGIAAAVLALARRRKEDEEEAEE